VGISKNFGAIQALTEVNLKIDAGEVLGLMGDNGAGKSTLIKIMAGNFLPSGGEMWLKGEKVQFHNPVDARKKGVEVVYQDLALCDNLTAAENVFLGREAKRRIGPLSFIHYAAMFREAARHFAELKSETRPRDLVKQMSGGQRQAVAIARTRLSNPDIVLMDEPTAAISVRQVAEVLDLIRRLRDRNVAVILISHPHARRVRGVRSCLGDAPGQSRRGQADPADFTRGSHRPDHRCHRNRLRPETR